ncbi:MAG: hypothetical protein FGM37_03455 [Phycisphaerales bacterium]|nr:hypothetical protein [Phycisphaerales bacterium]
MLDLQMLLATVPSDGTPVSGAAGTVVMTIILTLVITGAIMLAVAARRSAMGGRDSSGGLRPRMDRMRKPGDPPMDAWREAGRRMPVPPREGEP